VQLLTNNPAKSQALRDASVDVLSEVRLNMTPSVHNEAYLRTKRRRLGQHLSIPLGVGTVDRRERGDSRVRP
jgi:GTP cyclohydrolase II